MTCVSPRHAALAGALIGTFVLTAAAWIGLRPAPAQAQGIMSTPACQCSAPTAVGGLPLNVVHCMCGGVACVLSQHGAGTSHQLQCVK